MDTIITILNNMNITRTCPPHENIRMETLTLYSNRGSSNSLSSLIWKREKSTDITDLPPEVLVKMFLCLPVESIKMARLVCSTWCDIIDSAREFSLIVNDVKYDYKESHFPPWKITSCLIKYFHQHQRTNFLPNPAALRKLSIWGTISKPNFRLLMSQLHNLEELDLACDFFTSHKDFFTIDGVSLKLTLKQLRKLTLFSNYNIANHKDNLFGIFNQSMPKLTKLKITMDDPSFNRSAQVTSPEEVNIAVGLARFIAGQKNLKFLQISISPDVFCDEEPTILGSVYESPDYEAKLSGINLQICRLHVSPLYIKLLRPLLASQSGLKDFRIQSQFMEAFQIPYLSLENSLRMSVQTLGSIHLEWIAQFPIHPMTLLNFQLFSNSQHLKRLVLKRWWGFSLNTNGMAKITNLTKIPSSIEYITIEGFICSTEELKMLAESASFHKLAEIHLRHVGMYGDGVGINGAVTKALCLKESLNNLSLGPMKNQCREKEDLEYQELRARFKDENFSSGKIVTVDLKQYRRKLALKRRKEAQAEQRKGIFCICFHGK